MDRSKEILQKIKQHYGCVPNIFKTLSQSPAALKSYFDIVKNLELSELDAIERQIIYLTICRLDKCTYCLASHTFVSKSLGMENALLRQVCEGVVPTDSRAAALVKITERLLTKKGDITQKEMNDFFHAGFSMTALYDVITILAMKTISNYVEKITPIALDPQIETI